MKTALYTQSTIIDAEGRSACAWPANGRDVRPTDFTNVETQSGRRLPDQTCNHPDEMGHLQVPEGDMRPALPELNPVRHEIENHLWCTVL